MTFREAAEEWHREHLRQNAERIARKPSVRVSDHTCLLGLLVDSDVPRPTDNSECTQCIFLEWLRTYAADRARLESEGREVALAALDFDNWLGESGAAGFHFGEPC